MSWFYDVFVERFKYSLLAIAFACIILAILLTYGQSPEVFFLG